MTCLEKFKLDHPDMAAGCTDESICNNACPDEYGYSSTFETDKFCNSHPDRLPPCRACWNEQIREDDTSGK